MFVARMSYLLVQFFLFFVTVHSARILGIVPTPSFSHQVAFQPIWKELSKRGHHVVVLTTDPLQDGSLNNLREINIHTVGYNVMIRNKIHELIKKIENNPVLFIAHFAKLVEEIMIDELQFPEVQKLINNEDEHFDLVMAEVLYPSMFAFSERFKCPLIGIVSMDASSHIHNLMGNAVHPVLYPDLTLPFSGKLNFKQRIVSTLFNWLMQYFKAYYFQNMQERIAKDFFKNNTQTVSQLQDDMSMLFINLNPIFQTNRPMGPNTISFGGGTHLTKAKPLPQDIKDFLDSAKNGAIYFSLGSNVKSKDIKKSTRDYVLETFKELPYKVLWKLEVDQLDSKPANVKIVKWLPQQDVLRHKNMKLFITQGGLQSLEESIFAHVPLLALPFFGDQQSNAKKITSLGLGLDLDHNYITKQEFKEAIMEIITNQTYARTVKKWAIFAQDQPISGLEKAIWWTEYVIRHKGAKQLRSPKADIPLYQYYLLDVIGLLVAFITVILIVVGLLIMGAFKFLFVVKKMEKKIKSD